MEDIVQLPIYILKGVIIGIVASAPMGPVGILCIRRTIKKGRAYGLATGLGAAFSDVFYAFLTGYGLSLLPFFNHPNYINGIKIVGGCMLLAFGLYMYHTGPRVNKMHPESKTKGSLFRNFLTSFFITLCNPAIIFLFLALFNMLAPFVGGSLVNVSVGYAAIMAGAMLWWFGLTYVINKMSRNFGEKGIVRLNRTIGVIVIVISVVYTIMTLCGVSIITTD